MEVGELKKYEWRGQSREHQIYIPLINSNFPWVISFSFSTPSSSSNFLVTSRLGHTLITWSSILVTSRLATTALGLPFVVAPQIQKTTGKTFSQTPQLWCITLTSSRVTIFLSFFFYFQIPQRYNKLTFYQICYIGVWQS